MNARAILAEHEASERRVVRESDRAEYRAALQLAAQDMAAAPAYLDDCRVPFTVGASVIAIRTIAYQANDGLGRKAMACGTRGEIVAFGGTREYPTAAVQFDGRRSLHLFNARDLRTAVRVVELR